MRRLGSEGMGIDTIVASGKENTFGILSRTTNRRLRTGDHVLITLAPRYEGYHAAVGRVAAVGRIDERIEQAVAVAIKAQEATADVLRPGVTGAELDAISREVCRAAGLERFFAYSGIHSVGVVEFEAPILTSNSTTPLSADMVLSIDIPIFFAPWRPSDRRRLSRRRRGRRAAPKDSEGHSPRDVRMSITWSCGARDLARTRCRFLSPRRSNL
jgi:Xaa-Pro aminopeptidase